MSPLYLIPLLSFVIIILIAIDVIVKASKVKTINTDNTTTPEEEYTALTVVPIDETDTQPTRTVTRAVISAPKDVVDSVEDVAVSVYDFVAKYIETHKGDIIAMGVEIVADLLTSKTMVRIFKYIFAKAVKVFKYVMMLLGIKKLTTKSFAKMLEFLSKTATVKFLNKMGSLAAKQGLRVAKGFLSAAKMAGAAFNWLDMFSMCLDMTNALGYDDMQTKEAMYKVRNEYRIVFQKALYDEMVNDPDLKEAYAEYLTEDTFTGEITMDPLDNLEDINGIVDARVERLLEKDTDITHLMNCAIADDINNGVITAEQLESTPSIAEQYYNKYVDKEKLYEVVYIEICTEKGGLVYVEDGTKKCTYKEEDCNIWPLPVDNNGEPTMPYREFKNGKCVLADSSMRKMCDEMALDYDMDNNMCVINKEYCHGYGAEWKPNAHINGEYDCVVPLGQEIMEAVFGTQLTRAIKGWFDGDVNHKCGFTEDVRIGDSNKCIDIGDIREGNPVVVRECNKSDGQMMYYNEVDKLLHSRMDYSLCVTPDANNKLFLRKCDKSNVNQKLVHKDGIMQNGRFRKNCLNAPNTNDGTQMNIQRCDGSSNQKFTMASKTKPNFIGTMCEIESTGAANCPPGYTNNGQTCGRSLKLKSSDEGLGPYQSASCPPGYTNTGTTCHRWGTSFMRDYFSKAGKPASYDMTQCENKYGKGNCETRGTTGFRYTFPYCRVEARYLDKAFPDWYESDGFFSAGGRCYIQPHTIGTIEDYGVCPPREDTSGKYKNKSGALCYIDCAEKYGPGWYNNGTNCALDASTTDASAMTCPRNQSKCNNLWYECYYNTPPDYTPPMGVSWSRAGGTTGTCGATRPSRKFVTGAGEAPKRSSGIMEVVA